MTSKTVTKYTPISGMREVIEAPKTYTFVHWDDYERLLGAIRNQRAALAGLIEAIRSIEISGDDWQEHVGDRLARAYQAVGPGLFPQEIAALENSRVETTGRIPAANPQLQAHVTAVAEFMQELAPYLGLDDGLVSTRDFIDAARRIREWCHDHQTLPKLEYDDHCGCCARNKITVEVFARPAVEPFGKETIVTPLQGSCDRCEATGVVGVRHALCGGAFRMPTEKVSGKYCSTHNSLLPCVFCAPNDEARASILFPENGTRDV